MQSLLVSDILKDPILVSRESAHLLEDALSVMLEGGKAPGNPADAASIAVDFRGVAGIAPSFLDELLCIFESLIGADATGGERRLVVANPPMRLSLKFEAIARGHGMSVRALADGSWLLADSPDSRA